MKKIFLLVLLCLSAAAQGEEWMPLSADEGAQTLLAISPARADRPGELQVQIKTAFINRMDMMGLQYDASLKKYVVSCASGTILSRQQFLLSGEEVVWTFPESRKEQKASPEIAPEVMNKICQTAR